MHLSWDPAIKRVTQIRQLLPTLMVLCLSFGGAPGPFNFSMASERICNLINAIMHKADWTPYKLHGKSQHLSPPPEFLDDSIPFARGLELIIDIPVDPRAITNIYIDYLTSVTINIEGKDNLVRCDRAPLLAIDTCLHPLDPKEPIPCKTIEAMNKLHSEALLQEAKTILGWHINFYWLLIKLWDNKYISWTAAIENMLEDRASAAKILETTIGSLVHLGLVIQCIHHFMIQLCGLHTKAVKRCMVKINGKYSKDLEMMLGFLKIANEGISLNSIAF
jgi:hypothetical protein